MALVASIRWVMLARADFPLRPCIVLGPDGGCNRYGDQGAGGGDAGRVPRHSTESPEAVVRRVRARMRLNSSSRSVWPAIRIDGLIFLFSRSRSPTPPSRRPGPAITHIHVHDPESGRGSHDPALFRDVVEQVRASDTEPPRPRSMSMRGSFSPRRGDDRCSRDSPISVRGSGPDGPKSGAVSFRSGLLLGVVRQHVRIIHYNTVKYEHFGRIKARAVAGDSRKRSLARVKLCRRFVTNTQGCANRIVYQGCSSDCHEIGVSGGENPPSNACLHRKSASAVIGFVRRSGPDSHPRVALDSCSASSSVTALEIAQNRRVRPLRLQLHAFVIRTPP